VDPTLLVRVLNHGLVAAGRFLNVRVRMADHPGALAAALTRLAPLGANVVAIEHLRTRDSLAVGEVDVDLSMQTRGPAHCQEIIAAMRDAGMRLQEL
jgi:threonine dehydratase